MGCNSLVTRETTIFQFMQIINFFFFIIPQVAIAVKLAGRRHAPGEALPGQHLEAKLGDYCGGDSPLGGRSSVQRRAGARRAAGADQQAKCNRQGRIAHGQAAAPELRGQHLPAIPHAADATATGRDRRQALVIIHPHAISTLGKRPGESFDSEWLHVQ